MEAGPDHGFSGPQVGVDEHNVRQPGPSEPTANRATVPKKVAVAAT
jgi:hypothetical protein